jgi:hypothetical protein
MFNTLIVLKSLLFQCFAGVVRLDCAQRPQPPRRRTISKYSSWVVNRQDVLAFIE